MAEKGEMWYARAEDGKIFGPVTVGQLVEWAKNSQIGPGTVLSRDRTAWMAAPSLSALGMDWVVETTPGSFYGPFRREVVDGLQAEGQLPATARLYGFAGGESAVSTSSKELQSSLAQSRSETLRLQEELEKVQSTLAAREQVIGELESRAAKQAETTKRTIAFLESKLEALNGERDRTAKTSAAEVAAAREEVFATRERAEQAEARAQAAERRVLEAEKEVSRGEAERKGVEERLRAAECELADLREQLEAVTRFSTPTFAQDKGKSVAEVLEPEVVVDSPPPRATPPFRAAPGAMPKAAGLAALEAAARRELAAAQKSGFHFFGSKKS